MRNCVPPLVFLLLFFITSFLHSDNRLPLPDEPSQREAAELVETVFGDEIKAATSSKKRQAIVKKLMAESAAPNTSPASRYALLQAALRAAPDTSVAFAVIDEVEKAIRNTGGLLRERSSARMHQKAPRNTLSVTERIQILSSPSSSNFFMATAEFSFAAPDIPMAD